MALTFILMSVGLTIAAAPAQAATGDLAFSGCFSTTVAGCTTTTNSLGNAVKPLVSPDGRSVYLTGFTQNIVSTFSRDTTTGALTYRGCVKNGGGGGCVTPTHNSLTRPGDMAISPNGASVYVTARDGNSVTTFARDTSTGDLTYQGCIANAALNGCDAATNTNALVGARGIVVSPDGLWVYVMGLNGIITTFSRNASSGALSWTTCVASSSSSGSGCPVAPLPSFRGGHTLAMSPDGLSLYASGTTSQAITTFSRDTATGALTWVACIANSSATDGCTQAPHASLPSNDIVPMDVTSDGTNLYVGSYSAVTIFRRNTSSGALTFSDCLVGTASFGCTLNPVATLAGIEGLDSSPDGLNVYVSGEGSDDVSTFTRDPNTGLLTYVSCFRQTTGLGCTVPSPAALADPSMLTVSDDGRSVYVAGFSSVSLNVFSRTRAPAPTVSSITPSSGPTSGGTEVTISGSGFLSLATANVGASPCVTKSVSSSAIVCTTASNAAGLVAVTVTNPDGQSGTLNDAFTYTDHSGGGGGGGGGTTDDSTVVAQPNVPSCVKTDVQIPRGGTATITGSQCRSDSGAPIGTRVTQTHPNSGLRGDVVQSRRAFKLFCGGKHASKRLSNTGYGDGSKYCKRGSLRIRTNGTKARGVIRWFAPATATESALSVSTRFRT